VSASAEFPAGPGRGRRRLLGLGAALPFLGSCAGGERVVFHRSEPVALEADQGLAAIVVRRVAVQGCSDRFFPALEYIRRGDGRRRQLHIGFPGSEWTADPGQPLLIRTTYLLRLPAGAYAFFRARWHDHPTHHVAELPPLPFEVSAGRATYVGGLGVRAAFARGVLGCGARSGSFFFHADAASDIPFFRSRFPDLARVEIVDGTSVRPRWSGPPTA
jgi:hypothetical protein